MVESSVKTWSNGEGSGKPLQYSWLENPINSMKRKKKKNSMKRQKEENSSLPHSIVFLYLHCSFKKGLSLLALELYIKLGIFFPFSLAFDSLFYSAVCKSLLRQPLCLGFFSFGMVLVTASCSVL